MKGFLKVILMLLAALLVAGGLAVLLFLVTFKTSLWLNYPEPLKTRLALSRLELTDMENLVCHEDCMYQKELYEQVIADYLAGKNGSSQIARQIKDKILDGKEDIAVRQDLVHVLKMAEQQKNSIDRAYNMIAPRYLIDYLSAPGGDRKLKNTIISEFSFDPELARGAADALLAKITDANLGLDERIPAIQNMMILLSQKVPGTEFSSTTDPVPLLKDVLDYPAICRALLAVAEERGDIRLRYAALNNLICVDYPEFYSADIFNRLQNILFNEDNHSENQERLVGMLSGYGKVDNYSTIAAMKKVYRAGNLSKFARDIAASVLAGDKIAGYPEPQISDSEWQQNIDAMDEVRYYVK
jgi:hypothetical protein